MRVDQHQPLPAYANGIAAPPKVSMVDETVHNVTVALKINGMWNNTLLIMAGDNGSPTAGWGSVFFHFPLNVLQDGIGNYTSSAHLADGV